MDQLSLGVMARSRKENERRLPLHPHHLSRIPRDLRESVFLERGYGDRFGMSDDELKGWVAGFRTDEQLVEECDVILQPKPLLSDITEMRAGQVLWGWPHLVQDEELESALAGAVGTAHAAVRTRSSRSLPSTRSSR